ncbi:hypothetical protein [Spartinivicinus ruber]|uniref:hypothetical protein n=1 Tax=Spartinivicinus ruber TaxID=2683272 RepID=UPI0013D305BA|nr:hypothetical protein [Spartinivicinus ruber]
MLSQADSATTLNGDLQIDQKSLVASRVIAIRKILKADVSDKEDEQLLDIVNNIHLTAQQEKSSQEEKDLSALLFNQESIIWAKNNGHSGLLETENQEERISAYKQSWLISLNPPKSPNFKSRSQLAEDEVDKRYPDGNYVLDNLLRPARGLVSSSQSPTKDQMITRYKEDSDVIHRYYDQFSNYINQNLDSFVEFKVKDSLNKIKWTDRGKLFQKLWKINNIQEMIPRESGHLIRGNGLGPPFSIKSHFNDNAYFFKSHDGKLGIIKPDGKVIYLPSKIGKYPLITNNNLSVAAKFVVEKVLGVVRSKESIAIEVNAVQVDLSNQNINTIRKVVRNNIHSYLLSQINQWKESNYSPSGLETFFKAVIPFYGTIHNEIYDDSYTFEFKDIAFDTADLIFTLATIGFGAVGGYKGITAAIRAAKAGHSVSRLGRTATALRTILVTVKKGSFLRAAGKELTDFVVPVFTARNVSRSLVRASATGASDLVSKLRRAVHSSDEAASFAISSSQFFQKATDEEIINRLYTKIFELRQGTVGRGITIERIKEIIDTRASLSIPDFVYRGQTYDPNMKGLKRALGAISPDDKDAYLVEIIKHTASTGGSKGKNLSLSSDHSVANRFASNRGENARVFKIDTTQSPNQFRTVENILKEDGPRLVREGKIRPATLSQAIIQSLNGNESEIFYLGGDIPAEIVEMTNWRPIGEITAEPLVQTSNAQLVQSMASFSDNVADTVGTSSKDFMSRNYEAVLVTSVI